MAAKLKVTFFVLLRVALFVLQLTLRKGIPTSRPEQAGIVQVSYRVCNID